MVAAKYLDDMKLSNANYAKIGGISKVDDINLLEIEFLNVINYNFLVESYTFNEILLSLEHDEGRLSSPELGPFTTSPSLSTS